MLPFPFILRVLSLVIFHYLIGSCWVSLNHLAISWLIFRIEPSLNPTSLRRGVFSCWRRLVFEGLRRLKAEDERDVRRTWKDGRQATMTAVPGTLFSCELKVCFDIIRDEFLTYTCFCHRPERKPYRIDMFEDRIDFDNPDDSKDDYNDSQGEHNC